MDPDAALRELREMVADINSDNHHSATTRRLAERFEALDEWITNGGFVPKIWQPHPKDPDACGAGSHQWAGGVACERCGLGCDDHAEMLQAYHDYWRARGH